MLPAHNLGDREIDKSIDWFDKFKVDSAILKQIATTINRYNTCKQGVKEV